MAQAANAAAIHGRRTLLSDGHAQVSPGAHPPPAGFRVSKDSSDPLRAILSVAPLDTTRARTAGVSVVTAVLRWFAPVRSSAWPAAMGCSRTVKPPRARRPDRPAATPVATSTACSGGFAADSQPAGEEVMDEQGPQVPGEHDAGERHDTQGRADAERQHPYLPAETGDVGRPPVRGYRRPGQAAASGEPPARGGTPAAPGRFRGPGSLARPAAGRPGRGPPDPVACPVGDVQMAQHHGRDEREDQR